MDNGLGLDKPGGNNIYLSTFGGQFRSRITDKNPPIPGADVETRTNAKGNSVKESLVYSLEGRIKSINTESRVSNGLPFHDFVVQLEHESGQNYIVTFGQTSSDTFDVLNRMLNPSFDPTKKVKMAPYRMEKEGKPGKYNQGVVIYQNATGSNYTKEDKIEKFVKGKEQSAQLGIPPWEKQQTDQGVVYKKKPQLHWFLKKVMDKIVELGGRIEAKQKGEETVNYLVFPSSQGSFQTAKDPDLNPLGQGSAQNNGPSAAEQARALHGEPKQTQAPHYQEEDEDDLPF